MIVRILKLADDDWSYQSTEAFDHWFRSEDAALAAAKKRIQPIFARKLHSYVKKPGSRWHFKTPREVRERWSIAARRKVDERNFEPERAHMAFHATAATGEQTTPAWGSIGQGSRWKRPRRYWESDED